MDDEPRPGGAWRVPPLIPPAAHHGLHRAGRGGHHGRRGDRDANGPARAERAGDDRRCRDQQRGGAQRAGQDELAGAAGAFVVGEDAVEQLEKGEVDIALV
ncbi:hypothetical protein ACWEOE_38285 [Amycolatopsis sp. NPDC004368]